MRLKTDIPGTDTSPPADELVLAPAVGADVKVATVWSVAVENCVVVVVASSTREDEVGPPTTRCVLSVMVKPESAPGVRRPGARCLRLAVMVCR